MRFYSFKWISTNGIPVYRSFTVSDMNLGLDVKVIHVWVKIPTSFTTRRFQLSIFLRFLETQLIIKSKSLIEKYNHHVRFEKRDVIFRVLCYHTYFIFKKKKVCRSPSSGPDHPSKTLGRIYWRYLLRYHDKSSSDGSSIIFPPFHVPLVYVRKNPRTGPSLCVFQ